jgi:hypothetical protein
MPANRDTPMSEHDLSEKKVFSYAEAAALLPDVRLLTEYAYRKVEDLRESAGEEVRAEVEAIVEAWVQAVRGRGVEVKGLWLVDFDNGSGYYCWRYPEPALLFYHSYEEGFAGRLPIQ